MAEMKFNCPKCGQLIACDELWGGHQIQCPTCQTEIAVPAQGSVPAPGAPTSGTLVPNAPTTSAPRLSISQTRHQPSAPPPQASPNSTLARVAASMGPQKKKSSTVGKIVTYVLIAAACGVGGFYGFKYVQKIQETANEKSRQAAANSDGGEFGHAQTLNNVLDATEPGGSMMGGGGGGGGGGAPRRRPAGPNAIAVTPGPPGTSPAGKTLPVVPAVYTLDTNAAVIPESKVNGSISGTNFVAEGARFDVVSGVLALRFFQGTVLSPDRQMIVYLRLKAGDKLAGHTWNVSPEMKGGPQVMKLWKADPRLQPKTQSYSTGYAMKLELGKIAKGELSGKIFLALPDAEQSVIGGVFEAETKLPDTVEAPVATPAGSAAPQKPPPAHP